MKTGRSSTPTRKRTSSTTTTTSNKSSDITITITAANKRTTTIATVCNITSSSRRHSRCSSMQSEAPTCSKVPTVDAGDLGPEQRESFLFKPDSYNSCDKETSLFITPLVSLHELHRTLSRRLMTCLALRLGKYRRQTLVVALVVLAVSGGSVLREVRLKYWALLSPGFTCYGEEICMETSPGQSPQEYVVGLPCSWEMEGPAVVQAVEEVGLPSARQEVAAPRETTTFTGLVPHTQARDVRPGNRPYSAVDVTGMRERLVRAVSPLQTVEEARAGEFTPALWAAHHLDRHTHAQDLLQRSEKLRGQSRRTETYTEERTQSAENSVTHGLDQRLASTLELRTHLHHAINNTIDELALQNTMKSRLQVALFALELPERNNEECIHIRRFRFSVDRTRDPVVFALNKEKETLSTGRSLLTQTLKETEAQISRLLEVKRLLEHDWSDKQEAFQLDHFAAKLANDRVKAQFKAVSAALNEGVSVPDTWRLRSKEHLDVCRREITTGSQLRGAADQV
ncbi:hypothetical protein O3P69_004137 [Scylla paramamosain]|uniref:Tektin n=1 Tax=Scylla paramamosain TaxID=85552 RepID=A0AAW0UFA3_SCYPA